MTIQITTAKEISQRIKLTLYGNAGIGKTVLCAAAPRPIIISCEGGLLSLADFNIDIPAIQVKSIRDLKEAYEHVSKESNTYDTVCIDSLSEIAEVIFDTSLDDITRKAEEEGKNVDPRQAYGQMYIQMRKLTKKFRDIEHKNIIFTAKQGSFEEQGIKKYGPQFPGQAYTQNFPYFVDFVWCVRIDKHKQRILQTQPDFQYYCKTRGTRIPETIAIPNMKNVDKFIEFLADIFKKVTT